MDFVLWACRSLHIFSTVVWLGGLFFQGVVSAPVILAEGIEFKDLDRKMHNRFMPFIWTSVWTIFVTGFVMMLLSPRFVWFEYESAWSRFLLGKQLCYAVMIGLTVSSDRAWRRIKALSQAEHGGDSSPQIDQARRRFVRSSRRNIAFAILALLFTAGLDVY
ncbi:MAG: CopD family protein [Bacteroidota bacterium]